MRIAMISDVHGNIQSLEAVLADLDLSGPFDQVVYGGDLVFNGAFPSECVDRLRDTGFSAVRGNTDEFIVELAKGGDFKTSVTSESQVHSPALRVLDSWAIERLNPDQIEYLANWPLRIDVTGPDGNTLTICHATPWSAHETVFPDADASVAQKILDSAGVQAVAYGHIHVQYRRNVDQRLLCSVGSVGAPFDGDPRAAYAVFTNVGNDWDVEFRRVAYNADSAAEAVLSSSLPNKELVAAGIRSGRRNV